MWTITQITIKNLFSHQDTTLDFNNNKATLLYGVNKTDRGSKSNGSGKSSVLECISLALTGDLLRDVSRKEVIRNGEKMGEVNLTLYNTISKKSLNIIRRPHITKATEIEIWESGILRSDLKDMHPKESDKAILEYLDITKDDLMNYFLISKEKYVSFFLSNDASKKEAINRFSKANIIDPIFDAVKIDIEKMSLEIHEIEKKQGNLNAKIEVFEEQILKIKEEDIEKQRKEIIDSLKLKMKSYNDTIYDFKSNNIEISKDIDIKNNEIKLISTQDKQESLLELNENLVELNTLLIEQKKSLSDIEDVHNISIKNIDFVLNTFNQDISDYNVKLKEVNKLISEIEKNLADEIECPKCSHTFIIRDKSYDLEEAKILLTNYSKQSLELKSKAVAIELEIKSLDLEKKDIRDLIKSDQLEVLEAIDEIKEMMTESEVSRSTLEIEIRTIERHKLSLLSEIESLQRNLKTNIETMDHAESRIKSTEELIALESKREYENKEDGIRLQITNLDIELLESISKLEVRQSDKDELIEWQSRFKKFKSFLANNSISSIETCCNHFLKQMKTDLSIMIDGFRELSSGKLKEEITLQISRDGLNGENFGKFSGGEKSKVDLACILSMQKLINLTSHSGGLDFIFVDEVLESIDEEGMRDIAKALSNLNQTIMLISHVAPDESFECEKITIVKTKGISELIK